MRYAYKKRYEWAPDIAYVVGLIAADGCLINDGRHINLTSIDVELLEISNKVLNLRCKIGTKRNGFNGYGHFIQFSDVAFYDFLQKAGLTPAKSKTISRVNVPDEFYGDFLRGLFDRDGTIYGFWDKRWKKSLMYYTEFTTASRDFVQWIQMKNSEIAQTSEGKIKTGTRALKLSYAKRDSRKIFDIMYYGSGLPALERKRKKFVDFLSLDPYADRAFVGEWRN